MTDIRFVYDCEGEFSSKGLIAETKLLISIDEKEITREIAVIAHIMNDIEKSVMERYSLSRKDYETIRKTLIEYHS